MNRADKAYELECVRNDAELTQLRDYHARLAKQIRADAEKDGRALTERELVRIEEAQATAALCEQEMADRKPQGRKTEPEQMPGGRSQPIAAVPRGKGVVIPRNATNPADIIFGAAPRSEWDDNPDAFFAALRNGGSDPRLFRNETNTEGSGAEGGFLVPPSFFREVYRVAFQKSVIFSRCRHFPSSTNELVIPSVDNYDRSTSTAGLLAAWKKEGGSASAQKMDFGSMSLRANKLMFIAGASGELLEDGIGFETQLQDAMGVEAARILDVAILEGTGAGCPLGMIGHDSVIEVTPESGQTADTIIVQNLTKMYSRLTPEAQQRAVWLFNPSAWPQLIQMRWPDSNTPVLLTGSFNDAMAGKPAATILGLPAVPCELAPVLGDRGDLILADFSEYGCIERGGARIEMDRSLGFESDTIYFRYRWRVGGQPLPKTVVTPRGNGAPTLSWATVLGART